MKVKKTVGGGADVSMDVSIDWEHWQRLQLTNYLQDAAVAPSVPAMIEDEESDHDEAAESTVAGKPSEKVRPLRPFF